MERGCESTQHSPGPWIFGENQFGTWEVGLSEGHPLAGGGVSGCGENGTYLRVTVSGSNEAADAQLIAAAPDLLAFVESLVDANGPHADINGSSVIPRACELLRKITGKESA